MEYAHRKATQTLNNWTSNPTNGEELRETKEVGKARIERLQRGKNSLELIFPKEMKMQEKRSYLNFSLGFPASFKPHLSPGLRGKPRISQSENILKREVFALCTKGYICYLFVLRILVKMWYLRQVFFRRFAPSGTQILRKLSRTIFNYHGCKNHYSLFAIYWAIYLYPYFVLSTN